MNVFTKASQLKTQLEAVVYFIAHLDAEMAGDILDDRRTYQDMPKNTFKLKLGKALNEFK